MPRCNSKIIVMGWGSREGEQICTCISLDLELLILDQRTMSRNMSISLIKSNLARSVAWLYYLAHVLLRMSKILSGFRCHLTEPTCLIECGRLLIVWHKILLCGVAEEPCHIDNSPSYRQIVTVLIGSYYLNETDSDEHCLLFNGERCIGQRNKIGS